MENLSFYGKITQLAQEQPLVVATVAETFGATPRSIGAKMAIQSDGMTFGTIGGGCVENKVKQEALQLLQSGAVVRTVVSTLTGQPGSTTNDVCGGEMHVLLEKLTPSRLKSHGKELTLLVMAAGIGSRYGGDKQVEPLGPTGELLLEYSISDAAHAGFNHVVLIIRPELRAEFEPYVARWGRNFGVSVSYVYQEISKLPPKIVIPTWRVKPWGTAHAVLCAREIVHSPFAVINADDFYGRQTYEIVADFLYQRANEDKQHVMAAFQLNNTLSEYGTVSRGLCQIDQQGFLERVTEYKKLSAKEGKLYNDGIELPGLKLDIPVSMNIWGFTPTIFDWFEQGFTAFLQSQQDLSKVEYFIPLAVDQGLQKKMFTVSARTTPSKWIGITYREDVPSVRQQLHSLQLK